MADLDTGSRSIRVGGVTPGNAYQRELRRSDAPRTEQPARKPFRFSDTDVILDLTADALAVTGHDREAGARRPRTPPDTYTASGTFAYHDNPEVADRSQETIRASTSGNQDDRPAPKISVVAFDGQLRVPA